ncbi:hypothetical protein Scep_027809 [Stephania cephalantha]|uniref:Uncharacterized protein n=1 Tax=Stephania cephalantha TaxID=152367 RepID=A0AAP0EDA6_9MAGN
MFGEGSRSYPPKAIPSSYSIGLGSSVTSWALPRGAGCLGDAPPHRCSTSFPAPLVRCPAAIAASAHAPTTLLLAASRPASLLLVGVLVSFSSSSPTAAPPPGPPLLLVVRSVASSAAATTRMVGLPSRWNHRLRPLPLIRRCWSRNTACTALGRCRRSSPPSSSSLSLYFGASVGALEGPSIVGDLLDYLNESWTQFHATVQPLEQFRLFITNNVREIGGRCRRLPDLQLSRKLLTVKSASVVSTLSHEGFVIH